MTEEDILFQEKINSGTSWTKNEEFDKDGYFVVKNLWDPEELYHPVPMERGQINYFGSIDKFYHNPVEQQVEGSLARYHHPQYREIHSQIRIKLEKIIGRKLYDTYYYDRFYFPGQDLKKHTDRDACEISVTVHVSTNLQEPWPIWIKTPGGDHRFADLGPGDGMIYKGCERPHWRDPMQVEYDKTWYGRKVEKDGLYYHQIFFHYVLQDGIRAQCAWDAAR